MKGAIVVIAPLSENSAERYLKAAVELELDVYFIVSSRSNIRYNFDKLNCIFTEEITDTPVNLIELVSQIRDLRAIIAGGEFSVGAAEYLSNHFGLTASLGNDFRILRNKALMRLAFKTHGISQPEVFGVATSADETAEIAATKGIFPVISKPTDMAGSWYVSVNSSPEQVKLNSAPIFDYKFSRATLLPFEGACLIESFFDGQEYSADFVVFDHESHAIYINKKILSPLPNFNEVGHVCGVSLDENCFKKLKSDIDKIILAAEVLYGVLHVEFRVNDENEIAIIEVDCRLAGDYITNLVEQTYGVSLEKNLIQVNTGIAPDVSQRIISPSLIKFINKETRPVEVPAEVAHIIKKVSHDGFSHNSKLELSHISNRAGFEMWVVKEVSAADNILG
jgi:biotin carboxylase